MGASNVGIQIALAAVCHIWTLFANIRLGTSVSVQVIIECLFGGKSLDRNASWTNKRLFILGSVMIPNVLSKLFLNDFLPTLFATNANMIVLHVIVQL